jgi:hypothetical protein
MSYLRYLCLLAHSGVKHILHCVFVNRYVYIYIYIYIYIKVYFFNGSVSILKSISLSENHQYRYNLHKQSSLFSE